MGNLPTDNYSYVQEVQRSIF